MRTKKRIKVHALLCGGLGNQLFIYAMARRLSFVNNVELVLDTVTGFVRDSVYQRKFELHHFQIPSTVILQNREDKLARYRRRIRPFFENDWPLGKKKYIQEPKEQFFPDLIEHKINHTTYIEGYWQSYGYFVGIKDILQKDLALKENISTSYTSLKKQIQASSNAVAIHVRRKQYDIAVDANYYESAIHTMMEKIPTARFYCFSDDPQWCREHLPTRFPIEIVSNSQATAIDDFHLMSCCKHFIIANSSFSWWAAWLGSNNGVGGGLVLMPEGNWPLANTNNSPPNWQRINA